MSHRLEPGLCSVTFRTRSVAEVAALAGAAGMRAIEWGGDVHVPVGDVAAAVEARRVSADAGLEIVSYGSYLVGDAGGPERAAAVLDTAVALGAPSVRVWAAAPSVDLSEAADATAAVVAEAASRGLTIYLEFHGGTRTESAVGARALLEAVAAPNLFIAWQPPYWSPQDVDADRRDLALLGPDLAHVHVYEWDPDGTRHPLDRGEAWPERLAAADRAPSSFPRPAALLEFVADDDPARFAADAKVLLAWLDQTGE